MAETNHIDPKRHDLNAPEMRTATLGKNWQDP
jgi:hypothetical protein